MYFSILLGTEIGIRKLGLRGFEMIGKYVLSIDQGTTGTTTLLLDQRLNIVGKGYEEFKQHFPKPGWVEHDLNDIWKSTTTTIQHALQTSQISGNQIAAIGITNQRETTCLWSKKTGAPVTKAIVWQDRRTADFCEELKQKHLSRVIKEKTGLVLDPYFSGTKLHWLLNGPGDFFSRVDRERLAFGTIDSFLVYKLSGGLVHVTDTSNASRTLLMDLGSTSWDGELLEIFGVPPSILPQIRSTSEVYGVTKGVPGLPDGIPISGIAGDQQAALFGQLCFGTGEAKCTYGTGAFILMNTGREIVQSKKGLLTTVAWTRGGETTYALEGSSFIAGAAVQWLRDGLGIIKSSSEIEALAISVPDSGGVVFIPALTGLGAPRWNSNARGLISGLTRGTTRAHLARATLEGIAFMVYELIQAMEDDTNRKMEILKVDGGAASNNFLLQFQSDLNEITVVRPKILESTAIGAALFAGLAVGFWSDEEEIKKVWQEDRRFVPQMSQSERERHIYQWTDAISKL